LKRKRRYYVIYEDDQWKVKLERGSVIRTFGSSRNKAVRYAKKLGRRNNRPVMVNYKSGATGATYYKASEL
jgi:hypothetical protein